MASGKVAFVTGAASGIGRAAARGFVERGYATVLVDRDEVGGRDAEGELRQLGECRFVAGDVAVDESVRRAVEQTIAAYGRLDAAFNAAGVGGDVAPTAEITVENWNHVIGVNLTGVWFCMRHQIPQMLKSGGGAIVNCASVGGLVAYDGLGAYIASKHGVVGLTKTAAVEYIRQGIRINAVCPAMVDTPMANNALSPEAAALYKAASPIGRFATPEEIAAAALWLCEAEARFVTGQAIAVDGGWTAR